jgi:ankyrin repeat protein
MDDERSTLNVVAVTDDTEAVKVDVKVENIVTLSHNSADDNLLYVAAVSPNASSLHVESCRAAHTDDVQPTNESEPNGTIINHTEHDALIISPASAESAESDATAPRPPPRVPIASHSIEMARFKNLMGWDQAEALMSADWPVEVMGSLTVCEPCDFPRAFQDGQPALHAACIRPSSAANSRIIRWLLSKPPSIVKRVYEPENYTAFHAACLAGNIAAAQILLQDCPAEARLALLLARTGPFAGLNNDSVDSDSADSPAYSELRLGRVGRGRTALHLACGWGSPDMVAWLIGILALHCRDEKALNDAMSATDACGQSPAMYVIQYAPSMLGADSWAARLRVLDLLCRNNSDLAARDSAGQTVFHKLADRDPTSRDDSAWRVLHANEPFNRTAVHRLSTTNLLAPAEIGRQRHAVAADEKSSGLGSEANISRLTDATAADEKPSGLGSGGAGGAGTTTELTCPGSHGGTSHGGTSAASPMPPCTPPDSAAPSSSLPPPPPPDSGPWAVVPPSPFGVVPPSPFGVVEPRGVGVVDGGGGVAGLAGRMVRWPDLRGETPLHVACRRRQLSAATFLLESGEANADLVRFNAAGQLPHHLLFAQPLPPDSLSCTDGIAKMLSDCDSKRVEEQCAALVLRAAGCAIGCTLLDVNATVLDGGDTALHAAVRGGFSPEVVQLLVEGGADWHTPRNGTSPLNGTITTITPETAFPSIPAAATAAAAAADTAPAASTTAGVVCTPLYLAIRMRPQLVSVVFRDMQRDIADLRRSLRAAHRSHLSQTAISSHFVSTKITNKSREHKHAKHIEHTTRLHSLPADSHSLFHGLGY